MDYCHSNTNPFVANNCAVKSSPLGLHRLVVFSGTHKPRRVPSSINFSGRRRPFVAVARASNCESSSLNTPLEPKSPAGKYLSGLLLNDDTEEFQVAVGKQLEQLAADRDDAIRRADLSSSSGEACLHRYTKKLVQRISGLAFTVQPIPWAKRILRLRGKWSYAIKGIGRGKLRVAFKREEASWGVGKLPNLSLKETQNNFHLHGWRRIAELREQECQIAVEDIMYILLLYKFHEIKVHLVPRLSKCIYNQRLELWPSNDWELESIHSFEVLELIREHLTVVIGWKADSNVTDNWATTEIPRLQLCRVYAASILYGYFLKSASLRHRLELNLGLTCQNLLLVPELLSCGMKNIAFGRIGREQSASLGPESCIRVKKQENLKCYIMGFDPEILEMCAKPKTREGVSLVEKHSCALFGDENTGLIETNDVIVTSLSSLKRMVLEAVAFGSFLWDTEEYVDAVYKLKED